LTQFLTSRIILFDALIPRFSPRTICQPAISNRCCNGEVRKCISDTALAAFIAVLSVAVRERGEHAVIFDAGIHAPGAGSGVYFIVLSTPERTVARAMHLLR